MKRTIDHARRTGLIAASALLFATLDADAQEVRSDSTIRVLSEGRVARDPDGYPLTEPYLAVNPDDGNHLVAVSIVVTAPDLTSRDCAAFASFDGGLRWTRTDLELDSTCGDPWIAFAPDGTVLVTLLSDEVFVFRSTDGGLSWSDVPVSFGSSHDHETMVVAPGEVSGSGTVYLVSRQTAERPDTGRRLNSVFVTRSTDNGLTFDDPTRLFPLGLSFNTMTPVVLTDGTLVVPFSDYLRRAANGDFIWLREQRDWVVMSTDRGHTFSVPFLISTACEKSFPSMAVDLSSGPFQDRLYFICNDRDFEAIYLHFSPNGRRWSDPIRVNKVTSEWKWPQPYARTPAIAVNGDGVLGVSWYDGRNGGRSYLGIFRCQHIYFTASLDGGETFLPAVQVSTELSCPDTPENGQAGKRWPAGGDYHGLVARPDGDFQILWAESREGLYELRTARVRVRGEVPPK